MSAVRINCGNREDRETVLKILRTAIVEVPGAGYSEREIAFPATDEKGRPGSVEVRPFGEKFVEIEVVRE